MVPELVSEDGLRRPSLEKQEPQVSNPIGFIEVKLDEHKRNEAPFGVMAVVFRVECPRSCSPSCSADSDSEVGRIQSRWERRAECASKTLAAARTNPLQLRHFLLGIPKGGDLHYHLGGGIYAESFYAGAA